MKLDKYCDKIYSSEKISLPRELKEKFYKILNNDDSYTCTKKYITDHYDDAEDIYFSYENDLEDELKKDRARKEAEENLRAREAAIKALKEAEEKLRKAAEEERKRKKAEEDEKERLRMEAEAKKEKEAQAIADVMDGSMPVQL